MRAVDEIKEEHVVIRGKLRAILDLFEKFSERDELVEALDDFEELWEKHEQKEESYFDEFLSQGGKFPYHAMLVDEHKEFKGHWKVLRDFLKAKSDLELRVALDTDGKMLIEKFMKHSQVEDEYLDKYFSK